MCSMGSCLSVRVLWFGQMEARGFAEGECLLGDGFVGRRLIDSLEGDRF